MKNIYIENHEEISHTTHAGKLVDVGVALVANGNDMAVLTEGGGNPIVGYYTVANE